MTWNEYIDHSLVDEYGEYEQVQSGEWRYDGEIVQISELETQHIRNIMAFLKRDNNDGTDKYLEFEAELKKRRKAAFS